MYSSQYVQLSFPIVLVGISLYLLGLMPVYAAYRLRNKVLMGISLVCGLFSLWAIPPIISMILVSLQLPTDQGPRISKWAFFAYWLVMFLMFLFLPAAGFLGYNLQGYHLLGMRDGTAPLVVLFLATVLAGIISSALLHGRNLYMVEMVLEELSLGAFFLLSLIFFGFNYFTKAGLYVTLILHVLGMLAMCFITHLVFTAAGAANTPMSAEELKESLKSAGKSIQNLSRTAAGAVSSAIEKGYEPSALTCSHCGGHVKVSQRYCPNCGAEMVRDTPMKPSATSVISQCSKCGAPAKDGQRFCGRCGGTVIKVTRP